MDTFEQRFKLATKTLKSFGIGVYRNVKGCCRSCIGVDKFDNPVMPIIWHYGGQGNAFKMEGDVVYTADGGYETGMYFNHANLTDVHKDMVVKTFENLGIVIEWDKSDSQCLLVKPRLSVPHRSDEEQAYLVNEMLNKYSLAYSDMFGYRNKYMFESLWSLGISNDNVVESWFKQERENLDREAQRNKEWQERIDARARQDALRDQLKLVRTHDDPERFFGWVSVANIDLSEADVEDKGSRLVVLEDSLYVGAYSDQNDIVLEHFAEQLASTPKYFIQNLDLSAIRRELTQKQYHIAKVKNGWNEPHHIWKQKVSN